MLIKMSWHNFMSNESVLKNEGSFFLNTFVSQNRRLT
jgi:hypothetical protein